MVVSFYMTYTQSVSIFQLSVFNELKFALNALPETFINMLQVRYFLRCTCLESTRGMNCDNLCSGIRLSSPH